MSLNPFSTVGDYSAMLNKIGVSTFVVTLGAVALLRWQVHDIDQALKTFSVSVPLASNFSVPLGTVLPALLIAGVSRMIKLHDIVSSIFGIRRRFDVEQILLPLALATGTKLTPAQIRVVYSKRPELMSKVFYQYVSSTKEKPAIDKHYITMAMDQWSWYWMLVEANVVLISTGFVFYLFGMPGWTAPLLTVVLGTLIVLMYLRTRCAKYAHDEIDEILKVKGAARKIADELGAL